MKRYYSHKFARILALFIIDGLFFGLVDPRRTYALTIIVGFGLLVLTIYVLVDMLLGLLERIVTFPVMTRHRLHTGITMLLGLLIAMQSIGQLTVKDLLAIIPLVLVAAFYLSYQRKQAS
jgi:hypothetical protein